MLFIILRMSKIHSRTLVVLERQLGSSIQLQTLLKNIKYSLIHKLD